MPKIAQYDAPEGLGLRPTETGISAVAGAARRLQGDYSEAAASQEATGHRLGSAISAAGDVAVKYIEHQEISHGAVGLAGLIEAKSKQWEDTAKNADPNDPTVAKQFLEQSLEPDLEKFKSKGFLTEGGQKWAESHVDQFRQHMFHQTSATMSTLAGEAAVVNVRRTVNSLSNTVRADPASMDFALKNLESSLGGMVESSPNLTATAAAKVKTEVLQRGKEAIIKSAAMGAIEKTGEVPAWVSDPKFSPYIDGTELKQFAQAARFYESQRKSETRAVRVEAEHDARLKLNKEITQLDLSTSDEQGRPIVGPQHVRRLNEIVQQNELGVSLEPGLVHRMKNTLDAMMKRAGKPEATAAVSNETSMNLFNEIRTNPDDNEMIDKVDDAYGNGKLTWAARKNLMTEIEDKKTPQGRARQEYFTNRFGPSMDGGMAGTTHSLLGKQRLADAMDDAREQEKALRAQGINPRELYNPKSEHYFDKDGAARAKYSVSMSDAINYQASIGTNKAAPGGTGTAQGQDMKNPINLPAGVKTAEQIKALGIPSGTWIRFDNGDVGRLR